MTLPNSSRNKSLPCWRLFVCRGSNVMSSTRLYRLVRFTFELDANSYKMPTYWCHLHPNQKVFRLHFEVTNRRKLKTMPYLGIFLSRGEVMSGWEGMSGVGREVDSGEGCQRWEGMSRVGREVSGGKGCQGWCLNRHWIGRRSPFRE